MLRQFPDCRYLYVFFRSRTLGYDVYPEDHFLRNFPWQQYGGLWIVDDARFARSDRIDPHTAQVLRGITGEGASHGLNSNGVNSLNIGSFQISSHQPLDGTFHLHQPATHGVSSKHSNSYAPSANVDGLGAECQQSSFGVGNTLGNLSALDFVGMHAHSPIIDAVGMLQRTNLSKLTDVGRRYPGYPTPLSPTLDAKQYFPSPASEAGSNCLSPCLIGSPAARTCALMSADEAQMCGPQGHHVASGCTHSLDARVLNKLVQSPPLTNSKLISASPPIMASPRTAMLKNVASMQAFQRSPHQPVSTTQAVRWTGLPTPPTSPSQSPDRCSSSKLARINTNVASIPIANGMETCSSSPISPHGTMLSYTSNRSVESGLLGVPPLSEEQVAEYRFWRPCGRGKCAFGCGAGREGEWAAARRLFKSAEEVVEEMEEEEDEIESMEEHENFDESWVVERESTVMEKEVRKPRLGTGKLGIDVWQRERERDGVCEV